MSSLRKMNLSFRVGTALAVLLLASTAGPALAEENAAEWEDGSQSAEFDGIETTAADGTPGRKIVGTETDARGVKVIMRQGVWHANRGRGFGWEKIQKKHAIYSKHSVGFVLKNPNGGQADGNQRRYYAWANKKVCKDGVCTYVDNRQVYTIVDFRHFDKYFGVNVDGTLGVITTYCINPDGAPKCPAWVDLAIGSEAPRVATRDDGSRVTTVGSYKPLTDDQMDTYTRTGGIPGMITS